MTYNCHECIFFITWPLSLSHTHTVNYFPYHILSLSRIRSLILSEILVAKGGYRAVQPYVEDMQNKFSMARYPYISFSRLVVILVLLVVL